MKRVLDAYGSAFACGKGVALGLIVSLWTALPVAAEDRVKIVAFGDSLTHGYGLAQGDGFVPQLQAWLERADVAAELVNAGVSGDTTAGGAARIAWTLTPDVDGIIVALGGNDLLRGIDPASSRANLRQIVQTAHGQDIAVLLVGMEAPGNYGAAYKAAFDAIYPALAEEFETGFVPSFFLGFQSEDGTFDPAHLKDWMQRDGIHPNAVGVGKIVAALGPYVADLAAQAREN